MSHFLRPLLGAGSKEMALISVRTGAVLASHIEIARDSRQRRRGLLGRNGLEDGHALVLAPCNAIHTWFMRFPIDVVFAARDGRVLKTAHCVPAWRMKASLRAFATIELRAGALASTGLTRGDRLAIQATLA